MNAQRTLASRLRDCFHSRQSRKPKHARPALTLLALETRECPAANLIAIEKIAIRFEVRDATSHAPLPGSGTTLNAMVVNNNPTFLKVAMTEHLMGNACDALSGTPPHVAFTAYHPHLRAVSINVQSNSGAYNHGLTNPGPPPLPLPPPPPPPEGNTNPAVVQLSHGSLDLPSPGTLVKCTYLVQLFVTRRLFTSWEDADGILFQTPVGTDVAWTTFFYQP